VSHYIRRENSRPCESGDFHEVLGREPDPALAAEVADQFERLLAILPDPLLRRVALLRMAGHTINEIGALINRSEKTVDRRLGLIRRLWRCEAGEVGDECE
jgi:DNA-directed RNA polymerase specialized sigma24 family protein